MKSKPEKPESPPAVSPRPKIRLAGITTILGRRIAFLIFTGSEPGGTRECLVLAQGQRQHEIEVTEIEEKRGIVKVLNGSEEQTLNFGESGDARVCGGPISGDIDPVPSNPLTPEEQTILIEAQRLKALQDGDPIAKILPPTDLTPEIMADY